jgi:hypothetical protein
LGLNSERALKEVVKALMKARRKGLKGSVFTIQGTQLQVRFNPL